MKISKLFHWLYALLMLLPAFFVGGRMLYTIFNKNAKDSYSGNNEYEYQQVNEYSLNNEYTFNSTYLDFVSNQNSGSVGFSNMRNVQTSDISLLDNLSQNVYIQFQVFTSTTNKVVIFKRVDTTTYTYTLTNYSLIFDFTLESFENNYLSFMKTFILESNAQDNYYLDNAFTYSIEQLNEVGLFSWAKDSFIVEPFSYITGLFGIEQTSPINTLLSYWCSISVIWLVFDLLMYVPLLVHRWLDKGVLE